jgi:flagellar basal body-associated protein FliL
MADSMTGIETEDPAKKNEIKDEHPAKKKKKKLHFVTWIALASAVAAIVAAFISASSVNVAKAQNIAAEQQQLVTITIAIEQAFAGQQAAEDQAAGNRTGTARSAAVANADLAIIAETTADAQAAAVLISNLHGAGVAGIEYVTVARALANYGETALAITYYKDAVIASPHDVPTRADALRFEAGLYYSLGQAAIGHQDMIAAAKAYGGNPELSKSLIDNSIAQAYLLDAGYQIRANGCRTAATDMVNGVRAVTPLGTNGAQLTIQALESEDTTAYQSKCRS